MHSYDFWENGEFFIWRKTELGKKIQRKEGWTVVASSKECIANMRWRLVSAQIVKQSLLVSFTLLFWHFVNTKANYLGR